MNTTVNVKAHKINGEWCNIDTEDGKKVSINLTSSPKLKKTIDECIATVGEFPGSLTGNLVAKGDKTYLWDPREESQKKGFSNVPKDQSLIVAQSVFSSLCTLHSQSSTVNNVAQMKKEFEEYFQMVMAKKTI